MDLLQTVNLNVPIHLQDGTLIITPNSITEFLIYHNIYNAIAMFHAIIASYEY
jgi:hypothetical protein